VEEDEAGRLKGFRARFGTGFDANAGAGASKEVEGGQDGNGRDVEEKKKKMTDVGDMDGLEEGFSEEDANLMDLISQYNVEDGNKGQPWQLQKEKKDKKK
jgi:hypothetical protein